MISNKKYLNCFITYIKKDNFDGIKNDEPWHFDLSYSVIYSPIIENDLTQFALAVNEQIYDFVPKRHGRRKQRSSPYLSNPV